MAPLITMNGAVYTIWLLILFVAISFVFLLTILMSVLERSIQFGIMKAIGTRPREIFQIIFYESIFLGLVGTGIGLILGAVPSLYFTFIPLHTKLNESSGGTPLYAKLEPMMFLYTAIIIFTIVMVMTVFPALRASRIKPVQTLRLQ